MTPHRHTEFVSFVIDLVDFMEKRIRAALDDETARTEAAGDAAGVVPLLRDRLNENEPAKAQAMFLPDEPMYGADTAKWWADLGRMDRPGFEIQAADLLRWLALLRQVVAADTEAT
jgi:hypothetical protein